MMKKKPELATVTKREEEEHIIGIVKVCRTDLRTDKKNRAEEKE